MVGGYTENLTQSQNCENLGVCACLGMGVRLGNMVLDATMYTHLHNGGVDLTTSYKHNVCYVHNSLLL